MFTLEDDVYEEISVSNEDYEDRLKLMRRLESREKDRQELALESVFEELKKKATMTKEDDFETMTNQSMLEIKDEKKQVNIYKPTLKKEVKQTPFQQQFYP